MAVLDNNVLIPRGRMKKDGVTYYRRNGVTVMRSSTTEQPHRRTEKQFVARQRLAGSTALWKALRRATKPVLGGGKTSYGRFCTLMRKLPVTFLTQDERAFNASLLLPGMPVSDGILPDIEYHLGDVEGRPALLTSLRVAEKRTTIVGGLFGRGADMKRDEQLMLYRLEQRRMDYNGNAVPKVHVSVETLTDDDCDAGQPFRGIELRNVDGRLALVGEVFGDDMRGWALVRMDAEGENVSSQRVETRCRLYEQYTTDEALQRAAQSYGGLTVLPYLSPEED